MNKPRCQLLAALLSLMLLTGAASAFAESAAYVTDEPITFEVVMQDVTYIGDLNENSFGKWYEDRTNVHINYVEVPSDIVTERVNLMIASDELPDMFIGTVVQADVNGARGVFKALNGLIDEHGVETKKLFDEYPELLPGMITAVDGNIYALPSINACYHCMHSQRAWINRDWMTTLGLEYPNTIDEFEAVLRAFKDGDPNGNGIADEVPFTGANQANQRIYAFLLNSFVPFYDEWYHYIDESGTLQFAADDEAFRDGLRWIKKLIDEGLVDVMGLTQTPDQLVQLGSDPAAILLGGFTSFTWWQGVPADVDSSDNRSRLYSGLSPLEGPDGVRHSVTTSTAVQRDIAVITKKCANPEAAFKWLDQLYNPEVTLRSQVGELGVNYDLPPEGALGINGKPALYIQHWLGDGETQRLNTRMDNIIMANRSSDFRLGEMADFNDPETQWSQEPRLYQETHDYFVPYENVSYYVPPLAYTEQEGADVNTYQTHLKDYVTESIVLFLTGNKDLDKEWDSYLSQLSALHVDEYTAIRQTAYDRQYK
ncbi:MAG: extracellular solute-binding protein [Oscillospiraceae bacterium]|jgi:putative aldouronate transport system substrate-binding protein|nr:extracellular solute-binding protein [Oscillospiraceae bacterium]